MNTKVIITAIVVLAISALAIIFMLTNNETKTVYCGQDNSKPLTVFKDPTKAFPGFVSDYDVSAKASLATIDELQKSEPNLLNADMNFKRKVQQLREQLNQDNIRMENILKASFYAYNSDPCDDKIKERYQNLLDTLALKMTELERFKASVTISKEKGGTIVKNLEITQDSSVIIESIDRLQNSLSQ